VIHVNTRNPDEGLQEVAKHLLVHGFTRNSRNGTVLAYGEPVMTEVTHPTERAVLWAKRDANPFFHVMEALWMLHGGQDVAFVKEFNSKIVNYSDDGATFNGAYGHRWRHHFGKDQLKLIVAALKKDPQCRRQVLSMWDGHRDLGLQSKDLPCNTHAYVQIDAMDKLALTMCNRSNDLVWGAFGANVVHFTFLQEYLASALGKEMAPYRSMSANLHCYLDIHEGLLRDLASRDLVPSTYRSMEERERCPLMSLPVNRWQRELDMFMADTETSFDDPFFTTVAVPMRNAWRAFKNKADPQRVDAALEHVKDIGTWDWNAACATWLHRRLK